MGLLDDYIKKNGPCIEGNDIMGPFAPAPWVLKMLDEYTVSKDEVISLITEQTNLIFQQCLNALISRLIAVFSQAGMEQPSKICHAYPDNFTRILRKSQ